MSFLEMFEFVKRKDIVQIAVVETTEGWIITGHSFSRGGEIHLTVSSGEILVTIDMELALTIANRFKCSTIRIEHLELTKTHI